MKIPLSSGSLVETVVTLGAAVLMTLAGLAMVEDAIVAHPAGGLASAIVAAPRPVAAPS